MTRRESINLDNYITGNYGEDYFRDEGGPKYYEEPIVYRLNTAAGLCRGCSDRLRIAGGYCANVDWDNAVKQAKLAVDLRVTIFEMIDMQEWKHYAQRLPNVQGGVYEPLVDLRDRLRANQPVDPQDVRMRGGDGDGWDAFVRDLAVSMEVLADTLECEANR